MHNRKKKAFKLLIMALPDSILQILPDYNMFQGISLPELINLKNSGKIEHVHPEMNNREIFVKPITNSLFTEIEIVFDKDTNASTLTYHAQINQSDTRQIEIEDILKLLHTNYNLVFEGIKSEDSHILDGKIEWAYNFTNGKFSLGI